MILEIKKATLKDVGIISNIYALSWKSAYKGMVPQRYLDELRDDNWVLSFKNWIGNNILTAQIIFENEKPVGCIAYGKARDIKFDNWGEIVSIYILPGHLRKSYGQKLLQAAIIDMKETGYENCYLWVLKENISAQKFYAANGFISSKDQCTCEIMQKKLVDIRYILKLNEYRGK